MANTYLIGQDIWLTYVDEKDNGSRENWSVFYVDPIVTTSGIAAVAAGKKEISRLVSEDPDLDSSDFHAYIVGPITIS